MISGLIPRPIGLRITGDPQTHGADSSLGITGDPWISETAISLGIISNESGDHSANVWGSPVIPHQPNYYQPPPDPHTYPALERNSPAPARPLWINTRLGSDSDALKEPHIHA